MIGGAMLLDEGMVVMFFDTDFVYTYLLLCQSVDARSNKNQCMFPARICGFVHSTLWWPRISLIVFQCRIIGSNLHTTQCFWPLNEVLHEPKRQQIGGFQREIVGFTLFPSSHFGENNPKASSALLLNAHFHMILLIFG